MTPGLLEDVKNGDKRALARAISLIEADPASSDLLRNPLAKIIGVTGPPGVGKSTLVNTLISEIRAKGQRVAVVAVDPSSPLTGGALLGDRIRMQQHVDDSDVYIRSMATRGHLGGLAVAAGQTIALVSQAGFDFVLVETVGVGQSEVEIMDMADVVVLVVAPGWGDQIQADKAGIVEIADVFVINKADQPGVEPLRSALAEVARSGRAERPILITDALTGEGVAELLALLSER